MANNHSDARGTSARLSAFIVRHAGLARALMGGLQGLVLAELLFSGRLAVLHEVQEPSWRVMQLVVLLCPPLIIIAMGRLSLRQLMLWSLALPMVTAVLGLYDCWRDCACSYMSGADIHHSSASFSLVCALLVGNYLALVLMLASAGHGRWLASYPVYVETAWTVLFQFLGAYLLLALFWLMMFLGAGLLLLLGMRGLLEQCMDPQFIVRVSGLVYACALHKTSLHLALLRDLIRPVQVVLASTLPIATLFAAFFLLALPRGISTLLDSGYATAVLLGSAATLVAMIAAVISDGRATHRSGALQYWCARAAALCVAPLALIATYALYERVSDYGWTSSRLWAGACVSLAVSYGVGYAWAAIRSNWPGRIARVNMAMAFVVPPLLLLLMTPVADPERLGVDSQLARLASGKVAARDFDVAYLATSGTRYASLALQRLAAQEGDSSSVVLQRLRAAVAMQNQVRGRTDEADTEPFD